MLFFSFYNNLLFVEIFKAKYYRWKGNQINFIKFKSGSDNNLNKTKHETFVCHMIIIILKAILPSCSLLTILLCRSQGFVISLQFILAS